MSKKIHKLIPAVALALAATKASAQVLYEPFNYTVGTNPLDTDAAAVNKNYNTSGTYWAQRGSTNPPFTVGTGLGSPNGAGIVLPPTMGGSGQFSATNSSRTPDVGFGQTFSSGDVYYSLSFKIPAGGLATSGAGNIGGFSNFAVPSTSPAGVFQAGLRLIPSTTTAYQLGMTGGGTTQTYTGATFGPGDTVLVVARYRIVPGGNNDQVAMWINPSAGFGDNSAIPATSLAWNYGSGDATHDSQATSTPMIAGFFMRSYAATSNIQFDELRVDSTWAGVTPNGNLQYTWTDAGGGANTFANANKWTKLGGAPAAAPSGVGHVANFGSGIASGSSVTSAGEVIDSINFSNTGSITVDGTGLSIGSNASAGSIVAYAGNHTINAPLVMASNLSLKTSPGTSITLGPSATIGGVGKTLGLYGTGTVNLSASNMIDDTARLEVRSGTLNMNGNSETVDAFQLGTGALNPGTALPALYNGDLAVGTLSNGTITANSYDLQSGTIGATVAGTNGVVKNLAGFVTLSGNNTYTGNTVVNAGQLTLSGTNSNPVNAIINLTPQISGSINNLALTSNASLGASGASATWTADANVGSGTLLFTEDMTLAADRVLNLNHSASKMGAAAGKTGTIAAALGGTGGLGVTGSGTIILTAPSTIPGNTSMLSGTLQVSNQNQLGGGNLSFAAGTLKTGASLGTVSKTVALTAGSTGTVDTNGFDTTFAGVMSGTASGTTAAGAFTKAGAGTLVLSAANTYDGLTTVANGALQVTSSAGLGTATGRTDINGGGGLTNTAVLELDGTAGNITVGEEVRLGGKTSTGGGNSSASLRNLAGSNTVSNVRLDTGGTWYNIESAAGSNLTISGVTNALTGSTRNIFLKGAGDGEITGALTATSAVDSYIITKQGAGTWTLSGANTYSWANNVSVNQTTVEGGILRTTGVGTLGAAGGPVLNNATIQSYSNNSLGTVNGTGTVVVGDGATGVNVSATYFRQGGVSVANGSTASIAADVTAAGTSKVAALTVTGTGKFDLKRNKLITDTPVGSGVTGGGNYTAGSVSRMVQTASNGGAWDGPGLTTSEGDATAGLTSIGVALASDVRDFGVGTTLLFAGQTITPTSTLAMYTYGGDANLDGQITGDDYSGIDFAILDPNNTGGWFNGDFNYDGFVSGDDYSAIDFNILAQAPFPTAGSASSLSGVTAVPEPATLSVLALGAAALTGRRRRRAK